MQKPTYREKELFASYAKSQTPIIQTAIKRLGRVHNDEILHRLTLSILTELYCTWESFSTPPPGPLVLSTILKTLLSYLQREHQEELANYIKSILPSRLMDQFSRPL